ncbi:MAG TPA: FAD:protein FMN transferase [Gemmatimonadales bacterium]
MVATIAERQQAALEHLGFQLERAAPVVEVERADPRGFRGAVTASAMGTRVAITVVTKSRSRAESSALAALEAMRRYVAMFDRHDASSVLSHFNQTGRLDATPRPLKDLVLRSRAFHRLTGGGFDITVAPLLELLRSAAGSPTPRLPTLREIREVRELIGQEYLVVEGERLSSTRAGMQITLDGVAKGAIVDVMAATLRRHGIKNFLIDAGGDIRLAGRNERGVPWRVGVRDPAGDRCLPEALDLTGGAVATSGDYARPIGDTGLTHHIVNRAEAASPRHCRSVTVIAPTALAADALATGAFVVGPRRALTLIDRLRGCACLVIDRQGALMTSRRWPRMTPIQRERVEDHDRTS